MEVLLDTHGQRKLLILYLLIGNVAVAADCPKPEIGENMNLTFKSLETNDFLEGSQVTLVCVIGYEKKSGSGLMNCTDGKWTEPDLVCKKIDCGIPKADEHMYIVTSNNTEFHSVAKIVCEEGYQIIGSSFKICLAGGWYGESFCVIVTCSKPTEVKNGYTMVGNVNIRCTKSGEYDSEPPRCNAVTCSKPTKVENGKHSWNNDKEPEYQQKIYFLCNTGYTMFGNESIQCTKTGKYDSEPPRCLSAAYAPIIGSVLTVTIVFLVGGFFLQRFLVKRGRTPREALQDDEFLTKPWTKQADSHL
ncbi:sushi, von Willebrand factor type A, EGF and pentraxin domain-containing protein 1-like isoform X2 [Gambusia affinis]|uniref:sushi, von Willebrand factor type A, EGF and pentraxin domain-containing protein 1-like isoform X2 n=1 Tax=Gambusia affinis TaxID=33528 RepID=UPI001CDD6597|nr:sushi, von Willebrand factor type A, EGF and pentraxin domain-containing protein 1-like isoform X2 [Gambusia affinis]